MENNTHNKLSAVASAALVKAISEVQSPKFDAKNPHYGNKYATLGSHIDAIKGTFAKHGWTIIQHPSSYNGQVGIKSILLHVSGDQMEFSAHLPVDPAKIDAQKAGSIYSYLRRYALSAIANLAAEDDDGQASVEVTNAYVPSAKPSYDAPAKPKQAPSSVAGEWRNIMLHFGKNKGQTLGQLPANSLDWYAKEWQPKPYGDKGISEADVILRNALDEYIKAKNSPGISKPDASDDVPF
jgi:uncharacterized protein (DUF3820 family)